VLQCFGLPIEAASGGRTKYNRQRLELPKTHAFDVTCVGGFQTLSGWRIPILQIKCTGRGSYQRTRLTAGGFPRGYLMCRKSVFGFQTGDLVCAEVTAGKNQGYVGRVAVRSQRLVQHPNQRRSRSGYLAPALQSLAARRRLPLFLRSEAFRKREGKQEARLASRAIPPASRRGSLAQCQDERQARFLVFDPPRGQFRKGRTWSRIIWSNEKCGKRSTSS
jgi:hypothetical protein